MDLFTTFADAAGETAGGAAQAGSGFGMFLPLLLFIVVIYFFMIRPESKRKKEAENMRNSLKKGERITTIGGIVGKVVQVDEKTVVFETSEDRVRMEIAKWGIQSTESMEQAAAARKNGAKPTPKEEAAPAKEEKNECDPEIK